MFVNKVSDCIQYCIKIHDYLKLTLINFQLESEYINLVSSSSTHQVPTFLSFISGRFDSNSIHATFDSARLKTILFLSTSSNYDILAIKKSFEDMESKGLRGLTLERAIVYGKVSTRSLTTPV